MGKKFYFIALIVGHYIIKALATGWHQAKFLLASRTKKNVQTVFLVCSLFLYCLAMITELTRLILCQLSLFLSIDFLWEADLQSQGNSCIASLWVSFPAVMGWVYFTAAWRTELSITAQYRQMAIDCKYNLFLLNIDLAIVNFVTEVLWKGLMSKHADRKSILFQECQV